MITGNRPALSDADAVPDTATQQPSGQTGDSSGSALALSRLVRGAFEGKPVSGVWAPLYSQGAYYPSGKRAYTSRVPDGDLRSHTQG